jgi:hypothetical protein
VQVEGAAGCAADLAPPKATALLAPAQVKAGAPIANQVPVSVDFAGAAWAVVEMRDPGDKSGSYGQATLSCSACAASGWLCTGNLTCVQGSLKVELVVTQVLDGAGRLFSGDGPTALVQCGAAADSAAPAAACEAASPVEAPPEDAVPSPQRGCSVGGGLALNALILLLARRRKM